MNTTPIHAVPHPYAGETVPLLANGQTIGDGQPRAMFRIQDWADRAYGKPWRLRRSPSVLLYQARAHGLGLPVTDNQILRGHLLGAPLLIHTSEIDWSQL